MRNPFSLVACAVLCAAAAVPGVSAAEPSPPGELFLGPEILNGSFEESTLEGWGGTPENFTLYRDGKKFDWKKAQASREKLAKEPDELPELSAEAEKLLNLAAEQKSPLDISEPLPKDAIHPIEPPLPMRPAHGASLLRMGAFGRGSAVLSRMVAAKFPTDKPIRLLYKHHGARPGFSDFANLYVAMAFHNEAGGAPLAVHEVQRHFPFVPNWVADEITAKPPKNWNGQFLSVAVRVGPEWDTSPVGRLEAFFDDFRVTFGEEQKWIGDIAHFPSYGKLRAWATSIDPTATAARLTLTDSKKKRLLDETFPLHNGRGYAEYSVPELEGVYQVQIASTDSRYRWDYKLHRTRYPWERNQLGITTEVLPPFKPLIVKGQDVSPVLRTYRLSKLGLFEQIFSLDKPLLAAPMELTSHGAPVDVQAAQFTSAEPHQVRYESTAAAGGVTLKLRNTLEFDGCAKFELTLEPQGKEAATLDDLRLVIPLRDEMCPLWHLSRAGIRANPAGATRAGEGMILDSGEGGWMPWGDTGYANFLPYIWLGAERRGLCWFADNDKNWGFDPARKRSSMTLERRNGQLVLTLHLVQVPTLIDAPRTLVFGLMASPSKPMPEIAPKIVSRRINWGWVGSQYWGSDAAFSAKYPRHYNYGLVDAFYQARIGQTPQVSVDQWIEQVDSPDLPPVLRERLRGTGRAFMSVAGHRPEYAVAYFEEHATLAAHLENRTFGWEWSLGDGGQSSGLLATYPGRELYSMGDTLVGLAYNGAPSYTDFAVWSGAEFIKRGMGLYFDNVFLLGSFNALVSDAYAYKGPEGEHRMQPSALIWSRREYYKRIWTLHHTIGPQDAKPLMMFHMTNSHVLPTHSFTDSTLDLEWNDDIYPFQAKYPHDMLRVETTGLQSGNIPMALGNLKFGRGGDYELQAFRTRGAGLLIHGARHPEAISSPEQLAYNFGYGLDDCEVFHYWDEGYSVKTSNPHAKSMLLKRNGKLLLILCTWNPAEEEVAFQLDLDKIGLRPSRGRDLEFPDYSPAQAAFDGLLDGAIDNLDKPAAPVEDDKQKLKDVKLVSDDLKRKLGLGPHLPLTYDPKTGALRIPMAGYGVRLIQFE